jgi:hypothetical protein
VTSLPERYLLHSEGYLWYVLPTSAFDALPESIAIEGDALGRKDEFHVTIANVRRLADELAGGDAAKAEGFKSQLHELFAEYAQNAPISFVRFENDLRLASKAGRTSMAARCRMRNIEGYFERIKAVYGREFPLQPAHVSLYTLTGRAVGIDSVEEMETYPRIELPAVQAVLDSVVL